MRIDRKATDEALIEQINITVEPDDYWAEYEKQIKAYAKQANIPGFRPGQVPKGLIQSRFGGSLLADQLNQLVGRELTSYLQENEIGFMGRPFLIDNDFDELDAKAPKEYGFTFELGLEPEFEVDLAKLPKLTQYEVAIEAADVDKMVHRYQQQHGEKTEAEQIDIKSGAHYFAQGVLSAPAPKPKKGEEPGKDFKKAFSINLTLDPEYQKLLDGKKVNDSVTYTPKKFYKKDEVGAQHLRLTVPEYTAIKGEEFTFELRGIQTIEPLKADKSLFSTIFADRQIDSLEEFKQQLKEKMVEDAKNTAQLLLNHDIRKYLLESTEIALPDRIIQAWLLDEENDIKTEADLEAKYPGYAKEMRFFLIRRKLQEQFPEMEISIDELKGEFSKRYRGMLGLPEVPPVVDEEGKAKLEDSPATEKDAEASENAPEGEKTAEQGAEEGGLGTMDSQAQEQLVDSLVERTLQDQDTVEREMNNLQSARFFEVLAGGKLALKAEKVGFDDFERILATHEA